MNFGGQLPYPSRRQPIFARNAVATSQPLATQAGVAMLQRGGNAVDAALATAIALTVVEPCSNGIGSDLFAIVWDGRRLSGLNASGRAPAAVTPSRYAGQSAMSQRGWESVTIPGQVFSGERFPIDVAVEAPRAAEAKIELTAEGKAIGGSQVQLAPGLNRLRLQASVNAVGAIAGGKDLVRRSRGALETRHRRVPPTQPAKSTSCARSPPPVLRWRRPRASREDRDYRLHHPPGTGADPARPRPREEYEEGRRLVWSRRAQCHV
jgi:hypothetical protein